MLGAVLAGGASRRMGASKALLPWKGTPLVAHAARLLAQAVDEVIVVTRNPVELEGLGLTVVADLPGPRTPLSGIRTALRLAAGRSLFVAACDMPHLSPRFARALLALAPARDAVVPVREGRPEPLHAVWLPTALPEIEASLAHGHPGPKQVLERLHVRWVEEAEWRAWDPCGRSLTNVNTPEDWELER